MEDLALMLFAMLHRVTVPDNISAFRSQYLVKRDDKFTFEYDLTDAVEDKRLSVNHDVFISRGDRFSLYLENESGCFWQLRRPIPSLLICLGHQLSPVSIAEVVIEKSDSNHCAAVCSLDHDGV